MQINQSTKFVLGESPLDTSIHDAGVKIQVLELMETQGGSFASCLAKAWKRADLSNQARLMKAFGDLYREFEGELNSRNRRRGTLI